MVLRLTVISNCGKFLPADSMMRAWFINLGGVFKQGYIPSQTTWIYSRGFLSLCLPAIFRHFHCILLYFLMLDLFPQSLLTSWQILGATRSCCTPGRAGTMNLVILSRSTTRTLWSSATKLIELMVRSSPSAATLLAITRESWLKGWKIKGNVFVLFRFRRHWSLLALLV